MKACGLLSQAVLLVALAVAAASAQPEMLIAAPEGAVVLFDGTDLSQWQQGDKPAGWKVEDGAMAVTKGAIVSKETFKDAHVHVEFRTPDMPNAKGQGKGNSGVFIQGRYEIQVLDSYGWDVLGKGDCGAIYNQYAPLVNACRPAMEWQSYDIIHRSARVDEEGQVVEPARATVLHNGIVIHNNVELKDKAREAREGPLMLQDHGDPVQYRNIWLLHLPETGSDEYEPR